jgi:dihydrofolate reductase
MGTIIMIAAAGEDNALGKDNKLLWHLPDDFKRFKRLTTGHPIIMGRKTFESFPKPLANRRHIIISRNRTYKVSCEDCLVVHSLEEALQQVPEDTPVYIIGGGELYAQGMIVADTLEITRVHGTFEADTYFPEIDRKVWTLTTEEYHPEDENHAYAFSYRTYVRNTL